MNHEEATIQKNREELYAFLRTSLGWTQEQVQNKTKSHPPSHTVEEWLPHGTKLFPEAKLCKNLFLRDKKKGQIFLVVALIESTVDMKSLTKDLGFGSGTLRFAPDELLKETLGVEKGSVTPLGLFNDRIKHQVNVILDKKMVENDELPMIFHPLTNDYSTQLTARELKLFLQHTGHAFTTRDFSSNIITKNGNNADAPRP